MKKNASILTVYLTTALATTMATAQVANAEVTLNLNGYITQSYIYSPDNPYADDRSAKQGSFDFRTIGLYLNAPITNNFQINLLGLSNKFGELSDGEPRLEIAELQYTYFGVNHETGIKLGRSITPYGFFNQTRLVSGITPGSSLPTSVYFTGIEDIMLSNDGLNLFGQAFTSAGLVDWDIYYGSHQTQNDTFEFQLTRGNGNTDGFDRIEKQGIRIFFIPDALYNLEVGLSYLKLSTDTNLIIIETPRITETLKIDISNYLLSLAYKKDNITYRTEVLKAYTAVDVGALGNFNIESIGYYGQIEWQFADQFIAYATYEHYVRDEDAKKTPDNKFDAIHADLRWLATRNLNLTGGISFYDGYGQIPFYENLDFENLKKTSWLYRINLNYSF